MQTLGNYINNEAVASQSGRTAEVFNPATGEPSLNVALSTADETRAAIATAAEALKTWSKVTPLNRARMLLHDKLSEQPPAQ